MSFRSDLLLAPFIASIACAACGGASGSDGPLPTKSDARHDQGVDSAIVDEDTGVDEDSGVFFDDGALDASTTDAVDAGLVCALDEYDVNGDPSDGCEVKDLSDDHTFGAPFSFGNVSECDSGTFGGGYGWVTYDDVFPSDARPHGASLVDGHLGRPDYIEAIHQAATTCENDPTWQLTMSGGTGTYRVTLYRHGSTSEIDTKCSPQEVGGGETSIEFKCTGQDDGEHAIFQIEKVSGPPEAVRYTFKYHN